MKKIFWIISREYLERVKKKSFVIMTILGPLLMGAMVVLPGYFATLTTEEQKPIIIIDSTNRIAPLLDARLNSEDTRIKGKKRYPIEVVPFTEPIAPVKKQMNQKIIKKEIFWYLVIETDFDQKGNFTFFT